MAATCAAASAQHIRHIVLGARQSKHMADVVLCRVALSRVDIHDRLSVDVAGRPTSHAATVVAALEAPLGQGGGCAGEYPLVASFCIVCVCVGVDLFQYVCRSLLFLLFLLLLLLLLVL